MAGAGAGIVVQLIVAVPDAKRAFKSEPVALENADKRVGDLVKRIAREVFGWTAVPANIQVRPIPKPDDAAVDWRPSRDDFEAAANADPLEKDLWVSAVRAICEGAWLRLDDETVAAPRGGESNPHTRDAGARAWRERRKRPFVFGPPLFVVVARPLSLTFPPASRCSSFRYRRRTRRRGSWGRWRRGEQHGRREFTCGHDAAAYPRAKWYCRKPTGRCRTHGNFGPAAGNS